MKLSSPLAKILYAVSVCFGHAAVFLCVLDMKGRELGHTCKLFLI